MQKLFEALKDYNTFVITGDDARQEGELMLGVDIDSQDEIVFTVDAVKKCRPFVDRESFMWLQSGNEITVKVFYEDDIELDYVIKCYNDLSRTDVKEKCTLKNISLNALNNSKYYDIDQSRYIGDKKYFVVDLFKLGVLNDEQLHQLSKLFDTFFSAEGKIHNYSSTFYFTEDGDFGLWDYMLARPY